MEEIVQIFFFQPLILIEVHIIAFYLCASSHFIPNYSGSLQKFSEGWKVPLKTNEKLEFLVIDIPVGV